MAISSELCISSSDQEEVSLPEPSASTLQKLVTHLELSEPPLSRENAQKFAELIVDFAQNSVTRVLPDTVETGISLVHPPVDNLDSKTYVFITVVNKEPIDIDSEEQSLMHRSLNFELFCRSSHIQQVFNRRTPYVENLFISPHPRGLPLQERVADPSFGTPREFIGNVAVPSSIAQSI